MPDLRAPAAALVAGLLASCSFVASEEETQLPEGAWEPRDNGLVSERSPMPTGGAPAPAFSEAVGDAGATSGPDFAGAPVVGDAGLDSAQQQPAAIDAGAGPTSMDAGVPDGPLDGGSPQVVDADGTAVDAVQGQATDAGPSCVRGIRFCDGLDYVVCETDGRWSRRTCVDARLCFEATCERTSGCGSRLLPGAPCDGGPACVDASVCAGAAPDAGM